MTPIKTLRDDEFMRTLIGALDAADAADPTFGAAIARLGADLATFDAARRARGLESIAPLPAGSAADRSEASIHAAAETWFRGQLSGGLKDGLTLAVGSRPDPMGGGLWLPLWGACVVRRGPAPGQAVRMLLVATAPDSWEHYAPGYDVVAELDRAARDWCRVNGLAIGSLLTTEVMEPVRRTVWQPL